MSCDFLPLNFSSKATGEIFKISSISILVILFFSKAKRNLANSKISQLTNIPISNIDKIFSGVNKNPTLDTIQKIARVLECSIDDFIDYEAEPVYPIYINKNTIQLAEAISQNKDLKELFENAKNLTAEDMKILLNLAKRFNIISKKAK